MTSLKNTTVKDFVSFVDVMAQAGLSMHDVHDMLKRPQIAHTWVQQLHTLRLPAEIFRSAQAILDDLQVQIGRARWPFDAKDIERLEATIPALSDNGLTALSLDIWLGELPKTFRHIWDWIKRVHGLTGRRDFKPAGERLRLLDPGRYSENPSIDWAVINLAANWNRQTGLSPLSVRNSLTSPGLEVLVAAALHPKWIERMDGDIVPYVWLPGLQIMFPARRLGADIPCLHRQYGSLLLEIQRGYERREDFAVPELIGV